MTKEEYIESILSGIDDKYAKIEIKTELEAHLDDRIAFYTDAGYDSEHATKKAIERMGNAQTIAYQMNNLHGNRKTTAFIWILAILFCLISFINALSFNSLDYVDNIFNLSGLVFHSGVFIYTICFLLAARHKNYKAIMLISIFNLFLFSRVFSFLTILDTDDSLWLNSPLASSSLMFTHSSDIISIILDFTFNAFGIYDGVYMLLSGVLGVVGSAQIKSNISGTAKTSILKKYKKLNIFTYIAFSTEIISIIIFILSFIFLMRS